ncbi:MAG TPA: hypothetical protein PKA58_33815 [Polyangium sp.]|nr:hypothetical protein [Polyangium sp.]
MKNRKSLMMLAGVLPLTMLAACGDTDNDKPPTGSATSSSSSSSTSTSSSGNGGAGGGGGTGGAGGGAASKCVDKPMPAEIVATVFDAVNDEYEIKTDTTLTADKVWTLKHKVHVRSGATLTIEPCTTIVGDKSTLGTLIIDPGARILAEGGRDEPIVFTSQAPVGDRQAGDWGGVMVLGRAPINVPGGKANIEGLNPTPETQYGGDKPDDDSGILKYVRIEFSGILLSQNNEVNGLTFGGVGSKTQVEYVHVRNTLDDCFEFFGGTVNAKHLVCTSNQDDGFDWDFGYSGKLQFLVLQQDQAFPDDTNGFESDNDAMSTTNMPISNPTIYNATLVGHDADKQQYGWLARRSTQGAVHNAIVTGFEACIDIRDAQTKVELTNSICFGNKVHNVAYPEVAGGMGALADDDNGVDEAAWFLDPARKNSEADPKLAAPFDIAAPDFRPMTTLMENAATPPNDGFFDPTAAYIGAFAAGDTWMSGAWLSFTPN